MTKMRSSSRSCNSSTTSVNGDPREKIKDCCRKLVAFMCTQVGVGGLVVGYAIVGAIGFSNIETQVEYPHIEEVRLLRKNYSAKLWTATAADRHVNILNKTAFRRHTDGLLKEFQIEIVKAVKLGYNGKSAQDVWSLPAALMFCLSVFTMIGYGNIVPRTMLGKGATVVYAIFGIPLYVLYFLNMGKVLAQTFRWLYRWFHECTGRKKPGQRIIVPSTACLWVIFGYILVGTIMFAQWEEWDYLDSAYFCVTSLCKIGMGDFVPGANTVETESRSHLKLVINFIYLLLGLGLVAMCYNLMREDVREKARELREEIIDAFEEFKYRMVHCCRGN
ncbi:potassium channel subfamily K member 9 [Microplitis demolitor]|uniref:potassium channel subfamily K member 9 n=1 Tax=Microplitis demolitor TaxID=69319 RepID=UPI0004CCC5A1|nr:potassium channel subfamily K member 9 [Microplitis demolitor]XP_008561094.1 potassium channel subfamily K member 9 [Microplitis demolitor]